MTRLRKNAELFIIFFKIGCFTFGGGIAMLPLIRHEAVEKKKWVDENEITDIFALAQSLPGVIALNSSIFIGYRVNGFAGAIAASLGTILPAFLSIIVVVTVLVHVRENPVVEKVFGGIRAASAALILAAAVKMGRSAVQGTTDWIIAATAFTAIVVFNVHAAWTVIAGGAAGYCFYYIKHRRSQR